MRDDQRLLGLPKQGLLESGCVYGYRKLTLDLRELGERCGKHHVARFTQPGKMPGLMTSITSRCSTTQSVAASCLAASLR